MILAAQGDDLPPASRGFLWRPLAARSVAELRAQAAEYRRMAATATTMAVMESLYKLADRYDARADRQEQEERSKGSSTC